MLLGACIIWSRVWNRTSTLGLVHYHNCMRTRRRQEIGKLTCWEPIQMILGQWLHCTCKNVISVSLKVYSHSRWQVSRQWCTVLHSTCTRRCVWWESKSTTTVIYITIDLSTSHCTAHRILFLFFHFFFRIMTFYDSLHVWNILNTKIKMDYEKQLRGTAFSVDSSTIITYVNSPMKVTATSVCLLNTFHLECTVYAVVWVCFLWCMLKMLIFYAEWFIGGMLIVYAVCCTLYGCVWWNAADRAVVHCSGQWDAVWLDACVLPHWHFRVPCRLLHAMCIVHACRLAFAYHCGPCNDVTCIAMKHCLLYPMWSSS